jgi:hypothetical protein
MIMTNTLSLILSYFILITGAFGVFMLCAMAAGALVTLLGGPSAVSYSQEADDNFYKPGRGSGSFFNRKTRLMSSGAGSGQPFED